MGQVQLEGYGSNGRNARLGGQQAGARQRGSRSLGIGGRDSIDATDPTFLVDWGVAVGELRVRVGGEAEQLEQFLEGGNVEFLRTDEEGQKVGEGGVGLVRDGNQYGVGEAEREAEEEGPVQVGEVVGDKDMNDDL